MDGTLFHIGDFKTLDTLLEKWLGANPSGTAIADYLESIGICNHCFTEFLAYNSGEIIIAGMDGTTPVLNDFIGVGMIRGFLMGIAYREMQAMENEITEGAL